jgi:hypothetical protein
MMNGRLRPVRRCGIELIFAKSPTSPDIATMESTVRCISWIARTRLFLSFTMFAVCVSLACAQSGVPVTENATETAKTASELLKKIDLLVEHNRQLEKQNQDLMDEINSLREFLAKQSNLQPASLETGSPSSATVATETTSEKKVVPSPTSSSADPPVTNVAVSGAVAQEAEPSKWGKYTPNFGYKVVDTDLGDMSVSIYSYGRYLNQLGLNSTYTDAFGNVKNVQRRQDFQLNRVQIKFLGWIMSEKFRYFL